MARPFDTCIDTSGRAFAPSDTRQSVGRQGGRLSRKLRAHGLVAVCFTNPNPRSGEPIPTRPVTAKAVNDSGTTQYPDRKAEEGHGDKGKARSIGDSSQILRGSLQ